MKNVYRTKFLKCKFVYNEINKFWSNHRNNYLFNLEFVKELLNAGADPNFAPEKPNDSKKPILLAAYYGQHKVLQVLKENTKSKSPKKVRFDVWDEKTESTVLHLVLERPLMTCLQGRGGGTPQQIKEEENK